MQFPIILRDKLLGDGRRLLSQFTRRHHFHVLSRISKIKAIAFVCHGNINRSAFAQFYLKARHGIDSISFGTLSISDRMASVICRRIALRNYGIDMSRHRSRSLIHHKSEYVRWSDEIVVFDKLLAGEVRALIGPNVNVYMLDDKEIADPFGKPEREYVKCFKSIAERIDQIAADC